MVWMSDTHLKTELCVTNYKITHKQLTLVYTFLFTYYSWVTAYCVAYVASGGKIIGYMSLCALPDQWYGELHQIPFKLLHIIAC